MFKKILPFALISLSTLLLAACSSTYKASESDKPCRVMKPELQGEYHGTCKKGYAYGEGKAVGTDTYEGEFKKGLPDGDGTYIWNDQKKYVGEFKDGKITGMGKMITMNNGEKNVKQGYWEDGEYIAKEKVDDYKVSTKRNINRVKVEHVGNSKNQVEILFWRNGSNNMNNVENVSVNGSSGSSSQQSNSFLLEGAEFPLDLQVTYKVSRMFSSGGNIGSKGTTSGGSDSSMKMDVRLNMKINRSGYWRVYLYN